MTIHDFDMARFVAGSEVVEVYAQGPVRITRRSPPLGDIDTAVVTLRHANGCLTVIDNSRQAVYGYDQRVEAFGSAGIAASENPPAHSAVLRTAAGSSGRRSRLLPRALRRGASATNGWRSSTRWRRRPVAGVGRRRRAPLVIGLAADGRCAPASR